MLPVALYPIRNYQAKCIFVLDKVFHLLVNTNWLDDLLFDHIWLFGCCFFSWRKLYQAAVIAARYKSKFPNEKKIDYYNTYSHTYFINLSFIHVKNSVQKLNGVAINRWQIWSNSSPFLLHSQTRVNQKPKQKKKINFIRIFTKNHNKTRKKTKRSSGTMTIKMKTLSPSNEVTSFFFVHSAHTRNRAAANRNRAYQMRAIAE